MRHPCFKKKPSLNVFTAIVVHRIQLKKTTSHSKFQLQHFQKKCWKIPPPFSKSIPQIVNKHFLRLANQNTKPTSSFTSPEVSWMSLDRDNSFFEPKKLQGKKTQKVENFGKYVHSPNCELVVSFSLYFQKHLFTTSQAIYASSSQLFFSVGAVTGGHAGRLSCLETPQHPQVAPVGMGRCISGKNGEI